MNIRSGLLLCILVTFYINPTFGISLSLTPRDAACGNSNGSVQSSVSTQYPPVIYIWSSGQTTSDITNIPPGTYTLIVFDANGDSTGATVTVNDSPTIGPAALSYISPGFPSVMSHPCKSMCNGVGYLYTNYLIGTPPYSVYTNGGHASGVYGPSMIPTIQGICSNDIFDVFVSDANGCPGTPGGFSYYPPQTFAFTSQITPSCNGLANGKANFNFVDYFAEYVIYYSGPSSGYMNMSAGSITLNSLLPGSYNLTIVDAFAVAPCDTQFTMTIPNAGLNCGTVSGKVYLDSIRNCVADPQEPGLPSRIVVFNPGNFYSTSDSLGNYSAYLPYGNYTATTISNLNFTNVCTAGGINLSPSNTTITGKNIGDSTGVNLDLSVHLSAGAARPGFNYTVYATVRNSSIVQAAAATLVLDYNGILTFLSTNATSYFQTGPFQITTTLPPIPAFGYATVTFTFNIPPDPLLIGTSMGNSAYVNANQAEPNISNNSVTHQQTITGSFDPNEKWVWPSWDPQHSFFVNSDTEFDYTILFQNTGNDTAFTVVLVDTLNPYLKISSFEMTATSHPCRWEITGTNILKVHYDNILLPDSIINEPGSHGLFSFKIKPTAALQTVPLPYTLENRAAIYFDFNPPIITNTAFNTIQITVGKSEISEKGISIFPNPAEDMVYIKGHETDETMTISLIDLSGRILISKKMDSQVTGLDISDIAGGMYLITVKGRSHTRVEKLIKN